MEIILIILALIAGGFFIYKFDTIDEFIFKTITGDLEYRTEPIGVLSVLFCLFIGTVTGGSEFLSAMFEFDWDVENMRGVTLLLICIAISLNVFFVIFTMPSLGSIIFKIIFMAVSCIIGFVIGLVGSVVALALLALAIGIYIIGALMGTAVFGTGEKTIVKDSWGNKKTLTNSIGGEWRDESGDSYSKDGDTFTKD